VQVTGREVASQSEVQQQQQQQQQQRSRMSVPPFKPLPPGGSRPMAQQPERQRLIVQQNATNFPTVLKQVPGPSLAALQEDVMRHQQRGQLEAKLRHQQQRAQQELVAMQMLKQQRQQQLEAMRQQQQQQQQQQMMIKVQFPQQALHPANQMKRKQVGRRPGLRADLRI
jgi:hypothetical protein